MLHCAEALSQATGVPVAFAPGSRPQRWPIRPHLLVDLTLPMATWLAIAMAKGERRHTLAKSLRLRVLGDYRMGR